MVISKTVFIILLVSVFVGILIMILAFIFTRIKINKYKKRVIANQVALGDAKKVLERKNSGELLWNLRDQSLNPLEDSQLEFLINSALRNNYQTCNVIGSDSDYEVITLNKIANLKRDSLNPDFVILFPKNLELEFKKAYQKLKPKQMIAVVNASKNNQAIKRFLAKIKNNQVKYDYTFIGIGIILIVK